MLREREEGRLAMLGFRPDVSGVRTPDRICLVCE